MSYIYCGRMFISLYSVEEREELDVILLLHKHTHI